MADKAAQDIEALNIRDKERDDSERRDEVRNAQLKFPSHVLGTRVYFWKAFEIACASLTPQP
jgi:hypothetical protein